MRKQRFKKWFSPDVKPVMPGVYEVKSPYGSPGPWYSYFDGEKFGWRSRIKEEASENKKYGTDLPKTATWRDLAEDPAL